MQQEIMETVLKDILDEQKYSNQLTGELVKGLKVIGEKVDSFSQKLDQLKVISPPADTKPVQAVVREGLVNIGQLIEAQPKSVIRQFRLLLFPETNAGYYYKIVFGRLIPWGFAFAGGVFLISLGNKYVETSLTIGERRYYFEVYKDAWDRLDTSLDPAGRDKMKKVMQKAVNDYK